MKELNEREAGRRTSSDLDQESIKMNGFDQRFQRLSEEVGTIQIKLAERQKPWYREKSLILSVVALLFTIVFNLYGIVSQRSTRATDAISKSNENLQSAVAQLAEIRAEDTKDLISSKGDLPGYSTRASIRNIRRFALLDSADTALRAAKDSAPTAIYVSLGFEAATEGQYEKADRYYQLGVNKAGSQTNEKMWALFDQAQLRLIEGSSLHNIADGRKLYHQALGEAVSNDDSVRFQRGQLLARIAQLESANGNAKDAETYFRRADEEVEHMNSLNQYRDVLSQFVANSRQPTGGSTPARQVAFSQMNTWIGEWKLRYPRNLNQTGSVTFVSGAQPNVIGAYIDVFAGGRLVEKALGQVAVLDNKRIRVDWNSQRSIPFPAQTAGYSILKAAPLGFMISGEQYAFGEEAVSIRLSR